MSRPTYEELEALVKQQQTIPEGWKLVPEQMSLDADAIECICSQGGDGGHSYGDFTDVILWVGEVENDDGSKSKTHGLNVSSADYPEDGSVNLYEFAAQLSSQSAPSPSPLSSAITDIIAERQRQQSAEGWAPEHDDQHKDGQLATAASCYALMGARETCLSDGEYLQSQKTLPYLWPWEPTSWKPTNPRRNLVKAGALIAAEIERIDRASSKQGEL